MSRRVHPIRKMRSAVHRSINFLKPEQTDAAIARHVKPLLDALEKLDGEVEHGPCSAGLCPYCRLLAAWREPLK